MAEFAKFIPCFYGEHPDQDGVLSPKKAHKYVLIENIMHDMDLKRTSIIDIKLGTTTITLKSIGKGPENWDKRNKKDAGTT